MKINFYSQSFLFLLREVLRGKTEYSMNRKLIEWWTLSRSKPNLCLLNVNARIVWNMNVYNTVCIFFKEVIAKINQFYNILLVKSL